MYIGILMFIKVRNPVNDGLGFLGGGRIVQPNQLMAVYAFLKDREIPPHGLDIKGWMGGA